MYIYMNYDLISNPLKIMSLQFKFQSAHYFVGLAVPLIKNTPCHKNLVLTTYLPLNILPTVLGRVEITYPVPI